MPLRHPRPPRSFPRLLARLGAAGGGALLLASVARAQSAPEIRVPFLEGRPFAEVKKRAKAEKKPIMMDIYAVWCGPCKLMDRTTFADAGFAEWAKKTVVSAKVDAEKGEGRKLAARYAITSFPTILFLDADGNEIDRVLGAFQAAGLREAAEQILSGKSQLLRALAGTKTAWDVDTAVTLATALAQRNDLVRLRPLATRLVNDDPDLAQPRTLDVFGLLVAIEDANQSVSAETADLAETYLPRLGADHRRPLIAAILAREFARRGDVEGVRRIANAMVGNDEKSLAAVDYLVAQATAERKAGRVKAAVATARKALAAAQANGASGAMLVLREIDLAEALAAAGKAAEAQATVKSALGRGLVDVGLLARAARISVAANAPADAVASARRAVELSRGEDAEAQAALASSLALSGDRAGAADAWRRAAEIEPENAEYRREAELGKKKGAARTS